MALNLNRVGNTIKTFRENVLKSGGPQLAGMYEVTLQHNQQRPLLCYPVSLVVPGRQFVFYEHDLWGPNRRVPYKRSYTQCHMTFVIYQDWVERTYLEIWMNSVIKNNSASGLDVNSVSNIEQQRSNTISNGTRQNQRSGSVPSVNAPFSTGDYKDYLTYYTGLGAIQIDFLNSKTKKPNRRLVLKEAFPAQLNQFAMAADGSSYPMFNVTFQFNEYFYI